MSGGVDSSMTAALLLEAGHEVIGMTMRLYDASQDEQKGRGGTCCSPAEVDLARRVCNQLGIPHYIVDERRRFQEDVIDHFARDYAAGRTPNPCTRCNQQIKFGPLLRRARALGADVLATGHYARNDDGLGLRRGVDPQKDQSYFLFAMGRETLRATRFPLGEWTKDAVRERAAELGLPNAAAPDSQELCFVPGGNYADVVEQRWAELGLPVDTLQPGPVVDEQGTVVGEHGGIHRVTIGQRRGFEVRGNQKRYVLRVIPQTRTVVVGSDDATRRRCLTLGEFHRLSLPDNVDQVRALVQVRHRSRPSWAVVHIAGDRARVEFDEPVRSIAPGQAGVLYDEDERVLGGGWIETVDEM